MAAIVSIVGHSESGKTTLIEKLIREMVARGYNIATVKHTHHKVTPDQPEKDSRRHLQAGSAAAVLSSPDNVTMIKPMADAGINDIVQLLGEDYDLILVEGFKHGNAPKIEVHRKDTGPLLTGLTELVAIVSDEPLDSGIRQFTPGDVSGLADLIEKDFIKPQEEPIALYVNDVAIPMKSFIKDIVANVMVGIAVSLKGVGEVKKLKLFLRKR